MNSFNKTVARILIVTIACIGWPLGVARAELVSTDQLVARHDTSASRAQLDALMARTDVRAALEKQGVDPDQARERVQALSDEEIGKLAGKLDALPAGGDGIIGVLFTVFIVLLVTDILGVTKVFPFTRSIR